MKKFKKGYLLTIILVCSLALVVGLASATDNATSENTVTNIVLMGEGEKIEWDSDGYSAKGYKVVWSKNEGPTYPNRSNDKYHYYSDANRTNDTLTVFDGAGDYYVRVCEYLGGACGVYSNEITVNLAGEKEALSCSELTYSNCPSYCDKKCVSSVCSDNICTDDCEGEGSCFDKPEEETACIACIGGTPTGEYDEDGCETYDCPSETCPSIPPHVRRDGCKYNEVYNFNGCVTGYEETCTDISKDVDSIKLQGEGRKIEWEVDGYSAKGFKVVWSKNEGPTYPTRDGDKYHYYSDTNHTHDALTAFSGNGTYYVRVCEYLGGTCGVYSNEIKVELINNATCSVACLVSNPVCGVNDKTYWCGKPDAKCNNVEIAHKGECEKDKIVCTMNYAPVCGKNGKTYANKCIAINQNKVKVAYHGKCKDDEDVKFWYSHAKWECVDGSHSEREDDTSCKSKDIWLEYAEDFCGDSEVKEFEVEEKCHDDDDIVEMKNKAKNIFEDKYELILNELNELRDIIREQTTQIKYLKSLKEDVQALSSKVENAINNFITYGVDDNTKKLGAGERAAVIHSFKSAFKKLPETEDELADAIKIANGRWPSMTNEEAENKAKEQFKKIYEKIADMNNPNDNAAVTVMAYGLRQKAENRNLNSERNGIKIFQDIYGYHPDSTEDWNIMQAITYSGSSRGTDSDGDLLLDEREIELGTDPNNPDTDGDGYKDGEEVANGFDPLNK